MIIHNAYGVDLGTSSVKIYSQNTGKTLIEKNLIAVKNTRQVLAVGNDAFEMYEKAPDNISVDMPVKSGRIADVAEVEFVLHTLLRRVDKHLGYAPAIYFSAPVVMSEIERRAYYAISHAGDLRNPRVYLVDRPICDAISIGVPISRTKGTMIVGLGGMNTEISVIANEQVIISKDIPIGGQQINEAIMNDVRRLENLLIGRRTARRLKAVLATLEPEGRDARKVYGMNTLTGRPREAVISQSLVSEAVEGRIRALALEIRTFLDRTPPQIRKAVIGEGIYLTGGTARIPGLQRYLEDIIGCEVRISPYYEMCTINGLKELIGDRTLHKWAYTIRNKK